MKIQIKNRFDEKIIIEGEAESPKEFIQKNRGADLEGANLEGACLRGANLEVKVPPINSHQFVSEILFRSAKTEVEKDMGARIRIEVNQCWEYFIKLAMKKGVLGWAKKILFRWEEYQKKFEEFEK